MTSGFVNLRRVAFRATCWAGGVLAYAAIGNAQPKTYERTFPQSKAAIEKTLKGMQASLSGYIPILDGFAVPADRSLERYQRGYYQVLVDVTPTASGGSNVRVVAKLTAWYRDPDLSRSGYRLLISNGRIETDILDQISEQFSATSPAQAGGGAKVELPNASSDSNQHANSSTPDLPDLPSAPSPWSSQSLAPEVKAARQPAPIKSADPDQRRLQAELEQLQEILKNQAHPKNLVAVKKSGTAVVATPSLNAKTLFLASAHDEFELLSFNQDWVHVRISGLSRGWIWRNALEMPDDVPDTQAEPTLNAATDLFRVTRQETALFPGDWEPLRGKNVKIISVEKSDESGGSDDPQMKLEFAKSLFDKNYAEVAQSSSNLAGIVLIFDSSDGGMIAAPQTTLANWKAGTLSDAALWHHCFFDPPEIFVSSSSSASQ